MNHCGKNKGLNRRIILFLSGGGIGQFPKTNSCTAKTAGKKIVQAEPWGKTSSKFFVLSRSCVRL